jgi:hypothetical protein
MCETNIPGCSDWDKVFERESDVLRDDIPT